MNSVSLVALAVVAIRLWLTRRARPAGWLALAFLAIALLVTVGRLAPTHPHGVAEYLFQRGDIELLVLFPYLLFRFATIPSTLLLRRASRCWLFDEIALIRIDVADLRRTDDLPLGVTRRDLVPLGNVARLDPLACQSIAVAEGEEFEAGHWRTMRRSGRSVQRLSRERIPT